MKTSNGKTVAILKTDLCKINDDGSNYRVFIQMSKGGWLEHNPFPRDLRGLVAAMTLATEVCAGKFFPMRIASSIQHDAAQDELDLLSNIPKALNSPKGGSND